MSPELLDKEIRATKKLTERNFGVNLIVMHPQLDQLIEVCNTNAISHVILAGGLPKLNHIQQLKHANSKIICFAPTLAIAKKLIKNGVDALIIEGMEAGGHIGPVSTLVLAQEILPYIDQVPVFVAGGIARGESIAMLLKMGASGCQLGTRFVCARESIAHLNFKKAFIRASARDAVPSVQIDPDFPVIPVRSLANNATKEFIKTQIDTINIYKSGQISKNEAQLIIENFWAGALKKAVIDGDVENGSIMAGQSVGFVVSEQSVEEIIAELLDQANGALHVS